MKYTNDDKILAAATVLSAQRANPVEVLTPTNLDEAKEQFKEKAGAAICAGSDNFPSSACPTFVYNEDLLRKTVKGGRAMEEALETIENNVEAENDRDEAILKIVKTRANDAILTANAAQAILNKNDEETHSALLAKYDAPSPVQCIEAHNLAQSHAPREAKSILTDKDRDDLGMITSVITAKDLKRIFTSAMLFLGIKPWNIEIPKNCIAIDVRDISAAGVPTIFIPESRKVDPPKAVELICHEIFCHLRGSDNGQKFFGKVLADTPLLPLAPILAKSDNETLYEGVAKISDVSVRGSDGLPDPLTLVAIDFARRGLSFAEVAHAVYSIRKTTMSSEKALNAAWIKTYRVFRGATDTVTNKGSYAYPKDAAYNIGYEKAKELAKDPVYANYASMKIDEIEMLDKLFPEFRAMPRNYDIHTLIEKALDIVING